MKTFVILAIVIVVFLVAFFLWQYVFSIYETKTIFSPQKEIYSVGDEIILSVQPLNSFGNKAPLRKVRASIATDNNEAVKIKTLDEDKFLIKFLKDGKVKIKLSTKYSVQKELIEFEVRN